MSEVGSLWGNLSNLKTVRTPKTILAEQADVLNQATQGVVRAAVQSSQGGANLTHTLLLVAPVLSNYTYALCTVTHPIEPYPCKLYNAALSTWEDCSDEADFTKKLAVILSSEKTRRILESLLSQSKG